MEVALPQPDSTRRFLFRAICAGRAERHEIVEHVDTHSGGSLSRKDLVTVLGKEKSFSLPLWEQDGSRYELTAEGRIAQGRLAKGEEGATIPSKKQQKKAA